MTPIYAAKLGFFIWKTDINVQKIDNSALYTYKMVLASFSIKNKLAKF